MILNNERNSSNKLIVLIIFIFLVLIIPDIYTKKIEEFYDPAGDTFSYLSLGESIKTFNKFVRPEFINTGFETVRTPLYPIFISLFLSNLKIVILIQNILHILSAILFYSLINKILGKQKLSIILFLFYLFNPILVSLNQLLITESLSIFFITLSVFLLINNRGKYFFYLILGFLPLLRPAFIVLSFGVLIFQKFFEKDLTIRKFIIITTLLILPSVAWTVRNYQYTDLIIFTSISGMNLLEETASGIMAINEDLENKETLLNIIDIEYEERRYWSQVLRNQVEIGDTSRVIVNAPGPNPHIVANKYQSFALNIIRENLLEFSILSARSFIYILLEPGDHLIKYVFNLSNLTFYKFVYVSINFFIIVFTFKFIFLRLFIEKKLDNIIIYYMLLVVPLLLLSTPHARFGSVLIFFHLYFFSKEIKNIKWVKNTNEN